MRCCGLYNEDGSKTYRDEEENRGEVPQDNGQWLRDTVRNAPRKIEEQEDVGDHGRGEGYAVQDR